MNESSTINNILDLRDSDYSLITKYNSTIYILDKNNYPIIRTIKVLNYKRIIIIILLKSGWIATVSGESTSRVLDPKNNFTIIKSIFSNYG